MKDYTNHPGYDAPDCPLRQIVRAHPNGTSSNGYGCTWTGGHCLPGDKCDSYRNESCKMEFDDVVF